MSQKEVHMSDTASLVLDNVKKYIEKHNEGYRFIKDLTNRPELTNEITDAQWVVIIDQAWKRAYMKAWEDGSLSNEEQLDLRNIKQLYDFYHLRSQNRQVINANVVQRIEKVKKQKYDPEPVYELSNKSPYYMPKPWEYPKPSPYDNKDKDKK